MEPTTNTTEETTEEITTEGTTVHTRRTRTVTRSIEELDAATIKSMSEAELRKYVESLRDKNACNNTTINNLKEAAEKSMATAQYFQKQTETMAHEYQSTLAFIKQAIGTCYSSVIMAATGARKD